MLHDVVLFMQLYIVSNPPTPPAASAQKIPSDEQHWVSESFVDPNGRVFEWRGEIYRVLEPSYASLWKQLIAQGLIPDLIRDGLLVESELTDLNVESGKAVLHHRRIPVVSYCYEWLPAMLRDAALLTLELCIRLAEKGLSLQDGHPWNILFEGTKPVFIDASSIVSACDDLLWPPYQKFCNFFLFPLYLYAAGSDRVARWLMRDYLAGVTDDDLLSALPVSFKARHPRRTLGVAVPKWFGKGLERLPEDLQQRFLSISKSVNSGPASANLKIKFLESLRKDIASLKFGSRKSFWAHYYGTVDKRYFHTDLSPGDWQQKYQVVEKILNEVRPRSVLDVGTNTGQYATLAAAAGARVTACEVDVAALTVCYEQARQEQLNILPLAANVFSHSATPGRGGSASQPPTVRFRSELVMGLAMIHHVVAIQRLPIGRICENFAALSERWLLLEFAKPLRAKLGATPVMTLDDFDADALESCLRQHFKTVRRFPSFPDERKLFLCEK
jgi:SAM-dependent methyltransferase